MFCLSIKQFVYTTHISITFTPNLNSQRQSTVQPSQYVPSEHRATLNQDTGSIFEKTVSSPIKLSKHTYSEDSRQAKTKTGTHVPFPEYTFPGSFRENNLDHTMQDFNPRWTTYKNSPSR